MAALRGGRLGEGIGREARELLSLAGCGIEGESEGDGIGQGGGGRVLGTSDAALEGGRGRWRSSGGEARVR